jgi:hypothetical protein
MTDGVDHLRDTIADLMRWIEAEQLEATVIGGVAAGLQGQPRLTDDVDVVVLDADPEALIASGKQYGFEPRFADALDFSRRTRVLLMRHSSGVDVDLSLGVLPFEREVIERAQTIDAAGLHIDIATPEDLIIMKSLARRPQDIADIVGIIEVQPNLDIERIRRWVREFSSVLEMPEILDDLDLLLRRRKR